MTIYNVYKLYDSSGVIYIGCTSHLHRRITQHMRRRYGGEITEFDTSPYPDKKTAQWAEARLIFQHKPKWNKQGKKKLMPAGVLIA